MWKRQPQGRHPLVSLRWECGTSRYETQQGSVPLILIIDIDQADSLVGSQVADWNFGLDGCLVVVVVVWHRDVTGPVPLARRGPAPGAEGAPDAGGTSGPGDENPSGRKEEGRVGQSRRPGGPWWHYNAGRSAPAFLLPPRNGGMWGPIRGSASPCMLRGSLNVPTEAEPYGLPHAGSGTLYPRGPRDKRPL